jgi:ADP-ribose pyrophosphatase YjhB (NUDIX family)
MTDPPVGGATREVALGVVRRDEELLGIEDGPDGPSGSEGGGRYRLPGESVRPDEHGVDALRRAFRQFLETELRDVRELASFEADDDPGSGSVRVTVYEVSFVGSWPYRLDAFPVRDPVTGGNGDADCRWLPPSAFADGSATLSPAGAAEALGLGLGLRNGDGDRRDHGVDDRNGSDGGDGSDGKGVRSRSYSAQ